MLRNKIDPIEALERVKLMMKYDSGKTLKENKEQINEIWPYVVGGAAALGGLAYLTNYFERSEPKEQISGIIDSCRRNLIPSIQNKNAEKITQELYNTYLGAGTDEETAYKVYEKLTSLGEFCGVVKTYSERYSKSLYDTAFKNMFSEHGTTKDLDRVAQILGKLLAKYSQEVRAKEKNNATSCVRNLVVRKFQNILNDPSYVSNNVLMKPVTIQPENATPKLMKGITISSFAPTPDKPFNWETTDKQVQGFTRCLPNKCVAFQVKGTDKYYLIDHCYVNAKQSGGGSTQTGGGSTQTGGNTPQSTNCDSTGIYQLGCRDSERNGMVSQLQRCLSIIPTGVFDRSTLATLNKYYPMYNGKVSVDNIRQICSRKPNPTSIPPKPEQPNPNTFDLNLNPPINVGGQQSGGSTTSAQNMG